MRLMIPKIIHQFWDGPLQRPSELMEEWELTYRRMGWKYMLWDSRSVQELQPTKRLINQSQFDSMPEWAGKADIARYEILHNIGGIFIDADSRLLRPIDEFLLQHEAFCCFENEFIRPGLLSNGYLGSKPRSALTSSLIQAIARLEGSELHPDFNKESTDKVEAWKTTGPRLLTKVAERMQERCVAVFPSFYFIPRHYLKTHPSAHYRGSFEPFCDSLWGSTPGSEYSYAENREQNNTPLISICTITSNRKQFLPLVLKCIENQDYPLDKIEWIILDDSNEYSLKPQLNSSSGITIKYQKVGAKIKLGEKRNIAHKLCSGEFIVYMDDDDFYPPSRVSHAITVLKSSKNGIAASTILPIFFTHDQQLWISGPFGINHGTAGTFAMTREFARTHFYPKDATCNEEKEFLENYSIPLAQLNPELTMICISHMRNTFDKKKMRINGPTPRMRPAQENEFNILLASFSPEEYTRISLQGEQ